MWLGQAHHLCGGVMTTKTVLLVYSIILVLCSINVQRTLTDLSLIKYLSVQKLCDDTGM